MNRAIFYPLEIRNNRICLPADDRRYRHIRSVLKLRTGDRVLIGVVNGPRGEAEVSSITDAAIILTVQQLDADPDRLYPVTLLLGHPRPIVLKRILKDAATAGYRNIHVVRGQLSERSYMNSSIWKSEDTLREQLVLGAEQAGGTTLPDLQRFWSLQRWIDSRDAGENEYRCVLDSDSRHAVPFSHDQDIVARSAAAVLAVGCERGWSRDEISLLHEAGFTPITLGERILRTETAVQWAIAWYNSLV